MQKMCQAAVAVLSALASVVLVSEQAALAQGGGNPLSKLTVHGYLTQAYAVADFTENTSGLPSHPDEVQLGIPEDGTTDYRTLAIQFRYEMSPKDIMIIQLSNRSLGQSPIEIAEDEIELDWGFYERRLGDHSSVKVGRVQIPFGIYNEYRDVGTILPFYRPSFVYYREGSFTSETIDGLALSHTFNAESDWSLDADAYFGEFEVIETTVFGGRDAKLARASDAFGFQLWLNTPVPGLRFGLEGHQERFSGGQTGQPGSGARRLPGEKVGTKTLGLSIDLALEKFVFRMETNRRDDDASALFPSIDFWPQGYVQVGYVGSEKFKVYLQYERGSAEIKKEDAVVLVGGAPVTSDFDFTFRQDLGVSLHYVFSPNLVLKLEHHLTEHELFALIPNDPMNPTAFVPFIISFEDGSHTILSLSASF